MQKFLLLIFVILLGACTNEVKTPSVTNKHPYSPELFEKMKKNREFSIGGLFQRYKSPYPGSLTHEVSCPEDFHPVVFAFSNDQNKIEGYILFANERKVYGSCRKEDNVYRIFDGAVHCIKQDTILEIKWAVKADVPLEQFKQQIQQSELCK